MQSPSTPMPWWVVPGLATLAMLIFAFAIVIAWLRGDAQLLTVMLTGAFGLASQAGSFYWGSSAGSQKKDETSAATNAAAIAALAASAPVQPAAPPASS